VFASGTQTADEASMEGHQGAQPCTEDRTDQQTYERAMARVAALHQASVGCYRTGAVEEERHVHGMVA
jgi:hypothetical protein